MLLAGIFAGLKLHPSLWICAALFAAGLAGGIFFYHQSLPFILEQRPKRLARLFFCIAIFAAGMTRSAIRQRPALPGTVENFYGQTVHSLSGYISSPPVVTNSKTTLRVTLDKVQMSDQLPCEGRVLLVFYSDPKIAFQYGDRLSFSGTISQPPDSGSGFSYRAYLERDGITAVINNPWVEVNPGFSGNHLLAWIYQLRSELVNRVYRLFPKPEGPLMAGILLGDESKITSSIERDFQKTGTAHIIAISGANFTVLTMLMLSIIRRLVPFWWGPWLMLPFIAFYTVLVGSNSAVVRAAVMCGLSIFGSAFGRKGNGINNLALTAAVMCLWKPVMLYDLGFQLSATATLGILLFNEPLCNLIRGLLGRMFPKMSEQSLSTAINLLSDLCLMSISAQVFTTWACAQAFGQISLISLPANLLIAPFQNIIMLGGFAALLLSYIFYPLGAAAAWLVWCAPALTIRIVQKCAEIKWGAVYFDLPPMQAWLIIGLITAAWAFRHAIINSFRKRMYSPYLAGLLFFAAVMIWINAWDRLNTRTEIYFHQTAASSTIKIRTPQNHLWIIGDHLTNYAALDLLEKKILPLPQAPEAAWLDIQEDWMQEQFLDSGAAKDLDLLYLNGISRSGTSGLYRKLSTGMAFNQDDFYLQYAADYLGKRSWMIESAGMSLLIPNGIPPERIFTRGGTEEKAVSLVILGKRDDPEIWADYRTAKGSTLQVRDFSETPESSFVLTKRGIAYR